MSTPRQESSRATEQSAVLHRLKDSDLRLADPKADARGKKVCDSRGTEIGKVHDLLVDEEEQKVRFIEIASGGVLGIGDTKFLMPVEAITGISDDEVRTSQSGEKVAGSPRYDPDLIEQELLSTVYGHYGYTNPFWRAGYIYPRYPYY